MEILVTSILAFVSTNIDDIFLLTLFFGNKKFRDKEIITGQFLGMLILIVASLAGSLLGLILKQEYIGLLGLFPIYLGMKGLLLQAKNKNTEISNPGFQEKRNHL